MKRKAGVRYKVQLSGLSEILRAADAIFDPKKRLALMKKAIRAAGAVLLKEMRRRLKSHDRTGWLRKSMKSKLKFYKKSSTLVMIVGVASGMRTTADVEKRLGKAKKTVAQNIVSHNYAHLVFGKRKAFTQTINYVTKKGKRVVMQRRIAAYAGDNVITQVADMFGAVAKQKMIDIIAAGLKTQ